MPQQQGVGPHVFGDFRIATEQTVLANDDVQILQTGAGKTRHLQLETLRQWVAAGLMRAKGDWDAETNTPPLTSGGADDEGAVYRVSVAGSTVLDGIAEWAVGDLVLSTGTAWVRWAAGAMTAEQLRTTIGAAIPSVGGAGGTDGLLAAAGAEKLAGVEAGAQVNPSDLDAVPDSATRKAVSPTQLAAIDTIAGKAAASTTISAGTGLTGGGDLSGDRILAVDIASEAEAEAGVSATKLMSSLRTAQAIAALSPAANAATIADAADGSKVIMNGQERAELRRLGTGERFADAHLAYVEAAVNSWVEIGNYGARTLTDLAAAAALDTSAYRFRMRVDLTGVTLLQLKGLFTNMGTSGTGKLCLVFFPQDAEPTSGSTCYAATYESLGTKGSPTIPIDTIGAGTISITGTAAITLWGGVYVDERLRLPTVWIDVLHWGGGGSGDSPSCQNLRVLAKYAPYRPAPWLWRQRKCDFDLTADMGADNLVADGDPVAETGTDNTSRFHNIMQRMEALRAAGDVSRRALYLPSGAYVRLNTGYGKITADNITFYGTGSSPADCGFFTTTAVTGGNALKGNQLFRLGDSGVGTLAGRTSAWSALCWHPIKAVAQGQAYIELEANPVCKTADEASSTTDTGHGATAYAALNVGDIITLLSHDWYKSGSQAGWPSGAPEKPAGRWTVQITAKENTGGRYLLHISKAAPIPYDFPTDGAAYRSPYRVVSISGTEYYATQPCIVRLSDLTTSDSSHSLYSATGGNPFYNAPIWHVGGIQFHNLSLKSCNGEIFSQGGRDFLFDRVNLHGGAGLYGNAWQKTIFNLCQFEFSGMAAELSLNSDCNQWIDCEWIWTGDQKYGRSYNLTDGASGGEWWLTGARAFSFQERSRLNLLLRNLFLAAGYDPSSTVYASDADRPGAVGTGPMYFIRDTGIGNRVEETIVIWGGANGVHWAAQSEGTVRATGNNANGSNAIVKGCTFQATNATEAMVYKTVVNGGGHSLLGNRYISSYAAGNIQVNGTSALVSGTNTIADIRTSSGNIILSATMAEPVAIARIGSISVTANGNTPTYTDQTGLPDFGRYAS